jgi:RNA polymerase sigma-70 factor, ECF subfamily
MTAEDRRAEFDALFDDEERFRAWYDVAAPRLYRFLFGRCGGDAELTEELTQQAFVQAVHHRHRFDGRADPMTWLIAIGRNAWLDHVRGQDRAQRGQMRLVVREIASGREAPPPGDDDRDRILAVLRVLPATQRAAMILHHVEGRSVRSIAKELGRSDGAVEQLLSRARAAFRQLYGEADDG